MCKSNEIWKSNNANKCKVLETEDLSKTKLKRVITSITLMKDLDEEKGNGTGSLKLGDEKKSVFGHLLHKVDEVKTELSISSVKMKVNISPHSTKKNKETYRAKKNKKIKDSCCSRVVLKVTKRAISSPMTRMHARGKCLRMGYLEHKK